MFCKHLWILIDKTILESPFEQLIKNPNLANCSGLNHSSFIKKLILTFQCKKCSEIKTIINTNLE